MKKQAIITINGTSFEEDEIINLGAKALNAKFGMSMDYDLAKEYIKIGFSAAIKKANRIRRKEINDLAKRGFTYAAACPNCGRWARVPIGKKRALKYCGYCNKEEAICKEK